MFFSSVINVLQESHAVEKSPAAKKKVRMKRKFLLHLRNVLSPKNTEHLECRVFNLKQFPLPHPKSQSINTAIVIFFVQSLIQPSLIPIIQ